MTSFFLAIRVRPASRHISRAADCDFQACWLLAAGAPGLTSPPAAFHNQTKRSVQTHLAAGKVSVRRTNS